MSYAGTYGPDETCRHDLYRPNCWRCNGRPAQFVREYDARVAHVAGLTDTITPTPRTVYDAACPSCPWTDSGYPDAAHAIRAYRDHAQCARDVLHEWSRDEEMWAEVAAQGLPVRRLEKTP